MALLRRFLFLILIASILSASAAGASVYVAEPLLAVQPPAAGMTFYVYRPEDLPEGWFITFGNYAVTTAKSGLWVYGTMDGTVPVVTNYTVGSVNPALLPIVPYSPRTAGSFSNFPSGQLHKNSSLLLPEGLFLQPASGITAPSPMPYWVLGGTFTEVSNWNRLVDRMAVLETPKAPLAWKGDNPRVVFAWTGRKWHQMAARSPDMPEKATETLKYHLYSLTRLIHKSGVRWENSDTDMLVRLSPQWGYFWAGEIKIIEE